MNRITSQPHFSPSSPPPTFPLLPLHSRARSRAQVIATHAQIKAHTQHRDARDTRHLHFQRRQFDMSRYRKFRSPAAHVPSPPLLPLLSPIPSPVHTSFSWSEGLCVGLQGLDRLAADPEIRARGIRVRAVGRLRELPARLQAAARRAEAATAGGGGGTLTVCLAYGGREELVDAARAIAAQHASGGAGGQTEIRIAHSHRASTHTRTHTYTRTHTHTHKRDG